MIGIYRVIVRKYLSLFFILTPFIFISCGPSIAQSDLYGSVAAKDYLTGRFDPSLNSDFIDLSGAGIPCDAKRHFLRKDAAAALKAMLGAFGKEHPGVKVFVRSSTRTFYDQRTIWNDKWNGVVLVGGINLRKAVADPRERAKEILRYSSMPGTSRHHWGTDVDLNSLVNSYFEKGQGKIIYEWLRAHAGEYGFCQPYTAGRTAGYEEERWHWSYMPAAAVFLRDWNRLVGSDPGFALEKAFSGAKEIWDLAPVYVNGINGECI